MNHGAFFPFRDASLRIALAASIVAHVAVFTALGRIGGGSSPGARPSAAENAPALEIRLVTPPVADLVAPPAPAQPEPEPAPVAAQPDPVTPVALDPPLPAGTPGERDIVALRSPRVVLTGDIPVPRLGDALDNGALDGFPREVDGAVGVPDRIEVPYPPGALAAGREATVLAWAVIDANGAVEATHVVEGPPEFAAADRKSVV